jgi:quinoprotein glucose dehydrogenase
LRAFDKLTGKLLWQADLPAAGTPSVYQLGGREFVAIVSGCGKIGAPLRGSIVGLRLAQNAASAQ